VAKFKNGTIEINKVRLYYFFGNTRMALEQLIKTDAMVKCRLMDSRDTELGTVNFSLKDFHSPIVTRKAFNLPVIKNDCYLKACVCLDMTEHQINVTRIQLSYLNGVFLPPEDYFAADFLMDEWVELIPKKKKGSKKRRVSSAQPS
jgi:hypothetical protein